MGSEGGWVTVTSVAIGWVNGGARVGAEGQRRG